MTRSTLYRATLGLLLILLVGPMGSARGAQMPMDWYACSREPGVLAALDCLTRTHVRGIVDYMVTHQVRVVFKPMKELGKAYKTHDALTVITEDDHQIIYISDRHAQAPPQALAALISHEVMHRDRENSMAEERAAWQQEGRTWAELVSQDPALGAMPLGQSALVDRENAILALMQRNALEQEIATNVAYQGLPAHSHGF